VSDEQPASDSDRQELLRALETGPCHRFADWPDPSVPKVAAGVYTIWEHGHLIYVGMAGRGLTAEDIKAPDEPRTAKGLSTRLNSHASGRRSGDQFCVYVCDRFVVPQLSDDQQAQIGDGSLSLDALTRKHIHDRYEYRYVTVANGIDALALERDVQVLRFYIADDGYKLGVWAFRQRQGHAKGNLEADRERRLQELPGWTWDHRADKWEEGFQRLLDYVDREGDARVPQSYAIDGYKLGVWVDSQRSRYSKGTLPADRQRRLQDLPGWIWDPQADKSEEGFRRLLDYVEQNGDARVPYSCKIDGYPLGQWVVAQRSHYARGRLGADRQRRLQDLPGWTWDPYADKWEEGFERLLDYVERHGDARVAKSYIVDGYPLGAWVGTQRAWHANGKLDPDRRRRLQDVTGWTWDPFTDTWEEGFRLLLDYVERHRDARIAKSYTIGGYKLGDWVTRQRHLRSEGRLDADRERRLHDLPGWAWDAAAAKWEEGFRQLLDYAEHHGDARVPQSYTVDGYPLGAWVGTQRAFNTKGKLDPDRKRRLQDLPGWTWDLLADKWEEGFQRLLEYVERHGDARVPVSYTVDHYPLGRWVSKQRVTYARGTLDADRQRRLQQEVPGWTWDPFADQWEEGFSQLQRYVESNGDARVPRKYSIDGYQLGDWVTTQRQRHAKGTLDADRENRLQDLPGWTWKAMSST
jgi:Helicase associated domain